MVLFIFLLGAGADLGVATVHMLVRPGFVAEGTVFIRKNDAEKASPTIVLSENEKLTLVSAALTAARHDRAGGELPASAGVAFNASRFTIYASSASPTAVQISYLSRDAKAADCMVRALIKAYLDAQSAAWGVDPRRVSMGEVYSGAHPVQTTTLDNWSALAGACAGILVFYLWERNRRKRPYSLI
jgi:hypothetical protein